jgi:hypothetical protein
MFARLLRMTTLVAVTLAAWDLATRSATSCLADEKAAPSAESAATPAKPEPAAPTPNGQANLLPGPFNYYVHPGEAGVLGAQMYLSPRPTPPLVGHTYVTYPPLMPHELLYRHRRVYDTYNPGSGLTRTRVRWH